MLPDKDLRWNIFEQKYHLDIYSVIVFSAKILNWTIRNLTTSRCWWEWFLLQNS